MATLYPSLVDVSNLKVQPEAGELELLAFLESSLDDSFEVFFNSFLNGDRPDVIIMRKGYGVMIIEVKDWDLKHYYLDEKKKWRLRLNNAYIKSPIDQVLHYKENIFNLHLANLLEKKIRDFKYWNVISCAVYFHNASGPDILRKLVEPFRDDRKYNDFLKYNIDFIGNDNLNTSDFDRILEGRKLKANQDSFFFSDELYESFKRYLMPVWHTKEDGEKLNYSSRQKELILSEPREQRIKGVVGSGKTTVLAGRAVNAHLRTSDQVLILTYNITLKNYIHDRISRVRENFCWNNFYINNYHNFLTAEMNNLGVQIVIPEGFSNWSEDAKSDYFEENYYSNLKLFVELIDKTRKYKVILIDEIQDYKRPWMDIIKNCFLDAGGEYVLFGDEKQNIYDNEQENKDIRTNVKQRPSEMKECFRSDIKIKNLAVNYQKLFFGSKYDIDSFNTQTAMSFGIESKLSYLYMPYNDGIGGLYSVIKKASIQFNEHPNDIAVLGFTIDLLRGLECFYRYKSNERTNAMFETQEVWFKLLLDSFKEDERIKSGIRLFKKAGSEAEKVGLLAVCFTLMSLSKKFEDTEFPQRLSSYLIKHKASLIEFNEWYNSEGVKQIACAKKTWQMASDIKNIRDNKKNHFWFNSGTIKFSTIHSFKGWEAGTLILIIEPKFDYGDTIQAFDELIYVGLTRSRSNLVVLNYGNKDYHDKLETLFVSQ
jgi:hypothetical protein